MAQCIRDDDDTTNPSTLPTLTESVERLLAAQPSRRRLLLGGLGAATLPFLAGAASLPWFLAAGRWTGNRARFGAALMVGWV